MTPRPIYRWKSFWLGVLVAIFITWAWGDSLGFSSSSVWRQVQFSSGAGGVFLKRETRYSANPSWSRRPFTRPREFLPSTFEPPLFVRGGGMNRLSFDSEDLPKNFREYYLFYQRLAPRENWLFFFPYWLVMLSFAVPWSCLMIWRVWRMKRLGSAVT